MKKAYCVFENFNEEATNKIREAGVELTINASPNRPNGEELISLLKNYDILILGVFSKLTADMLYQVKSPKIIASLSVGLDHIDKSFFASPLITVVHIKTANAISVAEHIFALILGLQKRICESNYLVLQQQGHRKNLQERPEDISNKKLGLIGAGNITKEVIKIAKIFHMEILCYTKNPANHAELVEDGVTFKSFDEVLKESDIINVSIPLTDETEYLISKEKIDLMKPTATFINTSRADVVDTKYLIAKAEKYPTFYVGLDIDLEEDKELLSNYRSNVIVTPHTAGISKQAIERMDLELANHIISCLGG